jgi:predicted 2-oxoglutarate/Fe(II)-dependent dioxygenase YbiX
LLDSKGLASPSHPFARGQALGGTPRHSFNVCTLFDLTPVRRGERLGGYLFMQKSLVHDVEPRRLLHEMDLALMQRRAGLGEAGHQRLSLTAAYHHLLRRWTEA